MTTLVALKKKSKDIEDFIRKAQKKLFEFEIMQSQFELVQGKGKVYKSASDFMKHIKSEIK